MTEQSENKVTKTDTIDKSKPTAAPTKGVKGELSEQELEKATGGTSELVVTKTTDSSSPVLFRN